MYVLYTLRLCLRLFDAVAVDVAAHGEAPDRVRRHLEIVDFAVGH